MKRVLIALLFACPAFAVGTVVQNFQALGSSGSYVLAFQWTGDAVNGTVPPTVANITFSLQGFRVFTTEFGPGTPAPTNPYAVTLTTAAGVDVLNGGGQALSSTVASSVSASSSAPPMNGALTLNVTNSAPGAKGTVLFYLAPVSQILGVAPGGVASVLFTGGIISVGTPTTAPSMTVAGTSGGIPYFSSATTWASSPTLTANTPIFGAGAGNAPVSGTRSGNTTEVLTGTGTYTSGDGLVVDANGNIIDSGGPPGGGTGNKGVVVNVTPAATTNFPCPSATAITNVYFNVSALSVSITSSTQNTQVCNSGAKISFRFQQPAGGGLTVAMPAGYESCKLNSAPNAGTKCLYDWDGTNGRLLANTGDVGFSDSTTVAAPGTPLANECYSWFDSTDNRFHDKCNNSTTVATTVVAATAPANQFATAISAGGVVSFAAVTNAGLPAVTLNTGTSRTVANQAEIFICTGACTVTPLTPVAGTQLCVQDDDNVATAITLAAITGVQYETTARTSYKAANTSIVSTGVVKDQICIVGKDATHYNVWSSVGTWN